MNALVAARTMGRDRDMQMSVAEQEFMEAMLAKMKAGASFDVAAAAVVADGEAAWLKYVAMRPKEKDAFAKGMAKIVYMGIRSNDK